MDKPEYRSVGKSVRKKDSLQLLLGKPVYTEDIAPDALVVKLLRSPHANAMVKTIDASKAKKVPGVVDVYTRPVPRTWAKSRTRRKSALAIRGVPRLRIAISQAA